jgi:hypothetical protein
MSADYSEKEREFLSSLKEDTGRDLAGWMGAIAAQNLTHRNEIIDWLRRRGFMFSKASWLERIHNNAGKPIYGEGSSRARAKARPSLEASADPGALGRVAPLTKPPPLAPSEAPPEVARPTTHAAALEALLAEAKAFHPLARFVLAEIAKTIPGTAFGAEAHHVSITHGAEFAVLAISARELRLGLALGERPIDAPLQGARFTNPVSRISTRITHMIILTDARQVNDGLRALVREAAQRAS